MILISIFVLLIAAALPSIHVSPVPISRSATLIFISTGILAINTLNITAISSGISIFETRIKVTSQSQAVEIFICVIASIISGHIWAPWRWIENNKNNNIDVTIIMPAVKEYSIILLFTTLGGIILVSSTSLVTLYLGVELQSFAVYILASLYWNSEKSSSGALKYFFIGGLSSAFILIGGGVIYWQTGSTDIWQVMNVLNTSEKEKVELGLEIILLGILIKTAAAPFHNWAPDVYDDVPNIVTTWLTLMPKISLLSFLVNLCQSSEYSITWWGLLTIGSLLSIIIGTIVGLAQTRIKRLLAYSTISHVGFLLFSLSISTEIGTSSFLFYLAQYTITTLDAFLIIVGIGYSMRKQIEKYEDFAGQSFLNPELGLAISICLFSIAGAPPLVGFFGKISVLSAAINSEYYFRAIVAIVLSVISASYYLNIINYIHFRPFNVPFVIVITNGISSIHSYIIAILTLSQILFILTPTFVLDSTSLLALY